MPRHAFKFPVEVITVVKQHVTNAIRSVAPERYKQEPHYTAALVCALEGAAYQGKCGAVIFQSTVFDDRGRNSAESRFGADHAITATISDGTTTIRKAILVQAKLGLISELSRYEMDKLNTQIEKMRKLVAAPKILQIREYAGARDLAMISGNNVFNNRPFKAMSLADYFTAQVTTTLDGCTRPEMVNFVQDSSLNRVEVSAKLFLR